MKKEWKEGQDRAVELPDSEVDIFKIWVKWIYTGRLFLTIKDDVHREQEKVINHEWTRWSKSYAMADYLQDPDYKDAAIDALIDGVYDIGAPFLLASYIYPYSPNQSAHRKLAVDLFVKYWNRKSMGRDMNHPRQFIIDVFNVIGPALERGIKVSSPQDMFSGSDICKYHDHGPDKPCYRAKPAFRF